MKALKKKKSITIGISAAPMDYKKYCQMI